MSNDICVAFAANFRDGNASLPQGMQCLTFASMDDQLPRSMIALKDIHARYYGESIHRSPSSAVSGVSHVGRSTVGEILSNMKSNVLQGCRISFSGRISCYLNYDVHRLIAFRQG